MNQNRKIFIFLLALILVLGFFMPWISYFLTISANDIVFGRVGALTESPMRFILVLLPFSGLLLAYGAFRNGDWPLPGRTLFLVPICSLVVLTVYIIAVSKGNLSARELGQVGSILGAGFWLSFLTSLVLPFVYAQKAPADVLVSVNPDEEFRPGTLYSVESHKGKFGVVKLLAIDEQTAHVKIYKNKFDNRPAKVDTTTLSLGSISDPDGFGIGHAPLHREGFISWKPVSLGYRGLTEDDMEGYELWKKGS